MNPSVDNYLDRLCAEDAWMHALPPTLLVAAHPDDETIGAASRLARLGDSLTILYITDGAPRDMLDAIECGCLSRKEYAHLRQEELNAALAVAGLSPIQVFGFGLVDQDASHNLVPLTRRLAAVLRHMQPAAVITHPYEGGHPDHDATAFAVHAACHRLREELGWAPELIEMTSYHLGEAGIQPGEFLPHLGAREWVVNLSEAQRRLKRRMMNCYESQRRTLKYFSADHERFRPAPAYDFTQPPHEGRLFYEHYEWGMTGDRFRSLACLALEDLAVTAPR